jgi:hypothetical protein
VTLLMGETNRRKRRCFRQDAETTGILNFEFLIFSRQSFAVFAFSAVKKEFKTAREDSRPTDFVCFGFFVVKNQRSFAPAGP